MESIAASAMERQMGVPDTSGADEKTRAVLAVVNEHGGDLWAALAALLDRNRAIERELDAVSALVSVGYARAGRAREG
jgi:hypothetical protein